ncbi:BPTI/Kunitz domain-containing protein isoform X2 [Hoplias malabaricus]|uniref:BPTI/Kunitz domain-containing protein isoform X2 n=1 Tax=Hoplias malabaricus TaxID=27720 RepID=UPI003462788B
MRNCSSRAESLYPTDPNKACRLPKAQGECLGTYIRYYYDPAQRQCKSFFWTGCEGNGNRFLDKQRCNDTCFEIKDEIEESPIESDEEIDTPVGIILGVVLGIVGVIILIVVIVLAVKNKPSPKKPQAKAKKDSSSPGPESPLQNDKIEMA